MEKVCLMRPSPHTKLGLARQAARGGKRGRSLAACCQAWHSGEANDDWVPLRVRQWSREASPPSFWQPLGAALSSRSSPLQPATATAAAAATRARSRSSPLQPAARTSPQQQRMSPRSGRGSRCGWRSTRSGNRRMHRATKGGHGTRRLERSSDGRAPPPAELTRDAALVLLQRCGVAAASH